MALTSQVFVSHASDMELFPAGRSFVQAVLDGIGRAGLAAVDMRHFAAREGAPVEYCRQRVRECEFYVAVIGFRYGSQNSAPSARPSGRPSFPRSREVRLKASHL